jgi:hypothetical protein
MRAIESSGLTPNTTGSVAYLASGEYLAKLPVTSARTALRGNGMPSQLPKLPINAWNRCETRADDLEERDGKPSLLCRGLVDRGFDFARPGQDMKRAQPHGGSTVQTAAEARRLERDKPEQQAQCTSKRQWRVGGQGKGGQMVTLQGSRGK